MRGFTLQAWTSHSLFTHVDALVFPATCFPWSLNANCQFESLSCLYLSICGMISFRWLWLLSASFLFFTLSFLSCLTVASSSIHHFCTGTVLGFSRFPSAAVSLSGQPGEDLERNDGSPERPYYSSLELRDILYKKNVDPPEAPELQEWQRASGWDTVTFIKPLLNPLVTPSREDPAFNYRLLLCLCRIPCVSNVTKQCEVGSARTLL